MNISNIGERGFINKLVDIFGGIGATTPLASLSCEGIGDDCAIIDIGNNRSLVVTADMLVEDIHFLREAIPPRLLGRKSLSVNLSDVASMGAKPFASFLSIALPKDTDQNWIDEFIEGYHEVSTQNNTLLLGGDTVNGAAITINVTAVGLVDNHCIKRRSAAQIGDAILLSGSIGESAAGLQCLLNRKAESKPLQGNWNNREQELIDIHHNPVARTAEGAWLGLRKEVHAMLDLSDGLLSDIKHITQKYGALINTSVIPTSVDIKTAICGGEDYQLLFTVDAASVNNLVSEYSKQFGHAPAIIGHITPTKGIEWVGLDSETIKTLHSFSHF